MKKTMFITSVIMVVVMAIALTTSSLAWFTAGGADTVTTSTLKLQAAGTTSTGIAISHDGTQWANNIILSSTGTSGLNALVPFTGISNISGATDADVKAAFLAALVGDTEDAFDPDDSDTFLFYGNAADDTAYAARMIGAKIDSNRNFAVDETNAVMRTGYYTDTMYIKNLATGAAAANIKFNVDIAFGFDDEGTYKQYTSVNRGAEKYQSDAVLCVAVIARTDEFDDDDNIDASAAYADPGTWELISYADSKGRTNINLGKSKGEFENGDASASSVQEKLVTFFGLAQDASASNWSSYKADGTTVINVSSNSYKKNNTEELRPERIYAGSGNTLAPTIKTVKVIAWYDGTTLNNNNSSLMDLEFSLRFNKVVVE